MKGGDDGHAGSLISGRYRLGELLGTGGSASVFAAVDTRPEAGAAIDPGLDPEAGAAGRPGPALVALKILHPHLSRSDSAREAFFAEARAATVLRHPNIVAVLGVGVHHAGEHPQAWIALELAPGVSLSEHVETRGALGAGQALLVVSGVLRALAAAHAVGVIHRDVSPANIMVDPDPDGVVSIDDVRLLDFGLADAAGRPALGTDVLRSATPARGPGGLGDGTASAAPGVLGNVNYISPEQASGNAVDERGDLYQLGGVLYFALTGRPPFSGDSPAAVLRAHVQAPPPVPSVRRPGIPRAVDRIVVRALLKDPAARFPSAAAMADAIGIVVDRMLPAPSGPQRTMILAPLDDETTMMPAAARTAAVLAAAGPGAAPPAAPTTFVHDSARANVVAPAGPPVDPRDPGWLKAGRSRGRGGLWVAAMLVVSGCAVAWVVASGGSAPSSVAVTTSAPAVEASSDPAAGEAAHSAAPVQTMRMPELASLTLDAARAALTTAGLELGSLTPQDSPSAAYTVLGSEPAAGTRVAPGRRVDLVVASGSNAVPGTRGLSRADAVRALEAAGFVALTESRPNESTAPDTAIDSVPGDGTVLRLGASVTVAVAVAPAPSPAATRAPTAGPTQSPVPPTPIPSSTSTSTPAPPRAVS